MARRLANRLRRLRSMLTMTMMLVWMHANRLLLLGALGAGTVIGLDLLGVLATLAPEAAPLIMITALAVFGVRRLGKARIVQRSRSLVASSSALLSARCTRGLLLAAVGGAAAMGIDMAAALFALGPEVFPLLVLVGGLLAIRRRVRPRGLSS